MLAVQPKPDGEKLSIVTLSASPGSAPSTKIGPVTGLIRPKSSVPTSATVEDGPSWPAELSMHSKRSVVPGATVSAGDERIVPAEMVVVPVDGVRGATRHRSRTRSRS